MLGIVDACTWVWPSSCCRPSPVSVVRPAVAPIRKPRPRANHADRSEEHTSELQSLRHLVCRLLLEKKKKKTRVTIFSYMPLSSFNRKSKKVNSSQLCKTQDICCLYIRYR